jgi:hypothetical protein
MRRLVLAVMALGVICAGVVAASGGPGGSAEAAKPTAFTTLQKRLLSGTAL